jgi:hypothetical protein
MKSKRTRPRISHRAEKIIAALLEHPTQEKAAAAAGVSTVTVWRYLQKPAFQKALLEARQAAFSQAEARLQQAATAAAVTVLRTMTDTAAPPAIRLRAAEYVLERSAKSLSDQALEGRVSELERSAEAAPRQESGNPPVRKHQTREQEGIDVETISTTN